MQCVTSIKKSVQPESVKFCFRLHLSSYVFPRFFRTTIFANMSNSDSSSNSSYADVAKQVTVKRVTTKVKTVEYGLFTPAMIREYRSEISSTPSSKRKRQDLDSFSPIKTDAEIEKVCNDVVEQQSLKVNVHRRSKSILGKSRRAVSSKIGSSCNSASTQTTETEENALIQKYIDEVKDEQFARRQVGIKLQLEKENSSVLRSGLVTVLERAEITIDSVKVLSAKLDQFINSSNKPDLSTAESVKSYHENIKDGLLFKKQIHTELVSTLNSIKIKCHSIFADIKRSNKLANKKKHPWSCKTNSCRTISQSSSNSSSSSKKGILSSNIFSSKRIPFNSDLNFLRAPRSVQFKVPLDEYLENRSSQMTSNLMIQALEQIIHPNDKIEIDIPGVQDNVTTVQSTRNSQSQTDNIEKFRKISSDKIDFNLLNISQSSNSSSSSIPKPISQQTDIDIEWSRFAASSSNIVEGDDVKSLLDYSSASNVEDNSDVEDLLNYDSSDEE